MSKNDSKQFIGVLVLLLATLAWGSSFVVVKGALDNTPVNLLVALRSLIGGASLLFFIRKKLKQVNRGLILTALLLSAIYYLGNIAQTLGIQYTTPGRSAFITAAHCIFVPFIDYFLFKIKLHFSNLITSVVCLIGIGLIVLKNDFTIDGGDLYTLLGSLCFAFQISIFGNAVMKYDDKLISTFQLLFCGGFALIASLLTETMPDSFDWNFMAPILYLAIICTGFPMMFEGIGHKYLSSSTVSIIFGFEAVFAAIFSAIFYKETFTFRCLIGCGLVFASSFASVLNNKKTGIETN